MCLENRLGVTPRGFESHTLRQKRTDSNGNLSFSTKSTLAGVKYCFAMWNRLRCVKFVSTASGWIQFHLMRQHQISQFTKWHQKRLSAKKGHTPWRDTLIGVSRQLYSPFGELYCFAVVFGFRQVVFASRVWGRIEYHWSRKASISLLR